MFSFFSQMGLFLISWLGVAVLAYGAFMAWKKRSNLIQSVTWLCLADVGTMLVGMGSGTDGGQTGAVLQLVYTGVARFMAYSCATRLVQFAGVEHTENLYGIGKARRVTTTLFAFAMFAALGVSPFLTPDAKPFILQGVLAGGAWLTPAIMVAANALMAVTTVLLVHGLWLGNGSFTPEKEHLNQNTGGLALAGLLVLMGLGGHSLGSMAAALSGASATTLQGFTVHWHGAALIPFVAGVAVWCTSSMGEKVRSAIAIGAMLLAFAFALADTSLAPVGRLFAVLVTGIGLLVTIYSCGYIHNGPSMSAPGYFFFLLLMFGSLAGIATASTLGGFYVFWEIMTLTSYVLVAYEGTESAHKAAIKYFVMCSVAAAVMLPGLLLLSTKLGTLDIAALANTTGILGATLAPGVATLVALLALVGFGVKAGLVPGHAWLPDAHPAAPSSVSAPLSGVLTKAGIFGIVQVFLVILGTGAFLQGTPGQAGISAGIPGVGKLLTGLGLLTMLYGEFMALRQQDIKRLFAYSTMGQIGEITMTLGLCTWLATTGALLHVVNHAIMKDLLFLCSGALILRAGTRNLDGLKGLGRAMPFTTGCMVVGLIAIMGLPPFAGFMSKYLMLFALADKSPLLAGLMLLASLAGCVYYMRIVRVLVFEPYEGAPMQEAPLAMRLPIGILAALCVVLGLFPQLGLSLVLPVVNGLAASGKIAAQSLPSLNIIWQPFTLVLLLGAAVPVLLRAEPAKAGRATAGVLAVAAVLVLLFGRGLDTLSYIFAFIVPTIGAVNMYYASAYMDHSHTQWRFYAFFLVMAAGLTGVAASQDLFNFFLFWEIMSSWSLYFVIVHEENKEALQEGFKYFFFNVLGAAFLFLGVVLLVNWCGGAEFTTVTAALPGLSSGKIFIALLLMATGFVMKAAQLPFRIDVQMHPATAPTPVSGYISSVLLKSAIFGLAKLFLVLGGGALLAQTAGLFGQNAIQTLVVWVGGITIVMAAAYAVFQSDLKLVLIYSTVSQLGYMVVGVALGTSLGVTGGLLHLLNHVFFKDLLFLVAGSLILQSHRHSVDAMGGLGKRMPITMGLFVIGALCVIGVPPSNGFTSKWIIYHALMEQGHVLVAILSLLGSVITLAYFAKLMHSVFLGQPAPGLENVQEAPKAMLVPMGLLALACVVTSVFPGLLLTPLNSVLAQFSLTPLEIAPWGIASGKGAWNATVTSVLVAAAWFGGRKVLHMFTKNQRISPIHTCGIDPDDLNLRTTTKDIYSSPATLWEDWKK